MNPLLQFMSQQQAVVPQQNKSNIFAMAFAAMMSGKSPQEFLKTIPQLQGMDLSNINNVAQKLCRDKGINYEQAKNDVANQLNNMKPQG